VFLLEGGIVLPSIFTFEETDMKYRINLEDYDVMQLVFEVVDGKRVQVEKNVPVVVRDEMYQILRIPGVYKDGVETCDGVDLAGKIQSCEEDHLDIEARDLDILKKVFNKLISQEHDPSKGQVALGGERYIEMIQRVFKAEEIAD